MTSVPTFGFPERQPTTEEKALVDDVLNLCEWLSNEALLAVLILVDQLNPITAAYARYSNTARFSDPVSIADGLESIVRYVAQSSRTTLRLSSAESPVQRDARDLFTVHHQGRQVPR